MTRPAVARTSPRVASPRRTSPRRGGTGTAWDSRLHALEAGALALSAWMFASERLMKVNTSGAENRVA